MRQRVRDREGRELRYVRLSLTEACNFACPYCSDGQAEEATESLSLTEWCKIVDALALLGVEALRFTGGEPTLYRDLLGLIEYARSKGCFKDLAMTTNGSRLAKLAPDLAAAGLSRLTVSLDSLDEQQFHRCTGGRGHLGQVLEGLAISRLYFSKITLNTVIRNRPQRGDIAALLAFAREGQYLWRSIELMPFRQEGHGCFKEWRELVEELTGGPLEAVNRPYGYGPAQYFKTVEGQTVGFIAPLSAPYCSRCNRLRITASGTVRPCLLRREEKNIRSILQEDVESLARVLAEGFTEKEGAHGLDGSILVGGRSMGKIGG